MPGNGVAGWRDLPGQCFKDPQTRAERYASVPGGARRKNGATGFGPALGVAEADAVRACLIERVNLSRAAAADQ